MKIKIVSVIIIALSVATLYAKQFCCNTYEIASTTQKNEQILASYQQVTTSKLNYETTTKATTIPQLKSNGYKKMTVIATAYCPCKSCSGNYGNKTSTGKIAKSGRTVAVDKSIIPYGSQIIINGKTYIAEDCGGAIKGNRIDIYFDTHQEALNFGKQKIDIYVVK